MQVKIAVSNICEIQFKSKNFIIDCGIKKLQADIK